MILLFALFPFQHIELIKIKFTICVCVIADCKNITEHFRNRVFAFRFLHVRVLNLARDTQTPQEPQEGPKGPRKGPRAPPGITNQ